MRQCQANEQTSKTKANKNPHAITGRRINGFGEKQRNANT